MKVMFSAGEASGDTHAASVAVALKKLHPEVEMIGMGGEKMSEAGVKIVYDIKQLGYIGVAEIIKALPSFFKLRDYLKKVMIAEKPDVFVCVDYPGFNMKMAKVAHDLGIPVLYYICPTIWAWHRSRGYDVAKYTDKVACIFPFEAKAYEAFTENVEFVGHPLLDIVKPTMSKNAALEYFGAKEKAFKIMLMPGSRLQEVRNLLPSMLGAADELVKHHDNLQFFLPRAHTIDKNILEEIIGEYLDLKIIITEGHNYDLMQICQLALAASGTATLETALMNLPTILVYRVAALTYFLGKMLIKIPYVGLPNIIAGREIIPELIQGDVTIANITQEMEYLISDQAYYSKMKEDLLEVKALLGDGGAVNRVAQVIAKLARSEE